MLVGLQPELLTAPSN